MTGSGKTITFEYNADGLRVSKTVDGVVHNYVYSGGKLVQKAYGDTKLDFSYDAYGNPYTFTYSDGTISFVYHYVLNLQGDVVRLVTDDGITVATYAYDAWGNIIDMDYTYKAVADANPLRYRGYYYDSETGLYYLQSRYYNPQWGRFINADSYIATGQGMLGNNMFAYCLNNPVNMSDPAGNWSNWIAKAVSMVVKVIKQTISGDYAGSNVVYPYIHSQSDEDIATKKLGVSTVAFSGCGVVAVYNALITLGAGKPFDEVLGYFNQSASRVVFSGLLGILPHQVEAYFVNEGYRVITTNDPDGINIYSRTADASILWYLYPQSYGGINLFGAHFVHYAKSGQAYVAYNDSYSQTFYFPSDLGMMDGRYGAIGIFIYK